MIGPTQIHPVYRIDPVKNTRGERMTLLWMIGLWCSVHGQPAGEIAIRECLVIRPVGQGGRVPVHTDAIEAQMVAGTWKPPKAGDAVSLPDGKSQTWEPATAD